MRTRRALLIAAGLAAAGPAFSQTSKYPNRPIRLVVPTSPGSTADIAARLLAEAMRADLGQPMVVENRSGATGLLGVAAVANAPPDGYTVLMTGRSYHVMAHLAQAKAQVDPPRDLAPVGLAFRAVGMFAVHHTMPFRDLKGLVAYAKAQPGKLFYGSSGGGAFNHVIVEQFKVSTGIEMVHVPYKGTGALATALMAGEVQFAALDFGSAQAGVQSGKIVAIAQTGSRRHQTLAEVPTLIESGYGAQDLSFWMGLAVPRDTPPDVVAHLNRAMNAALTQPRVKAVAQVNGWEVCGGGPEVLAAVIDKDMVEYPLLFRKLDIHTN